MADGARRTGRSARWSRARLDGCESREADALAGIRLDGRASEGLVPARHLLLAGAVLALNQHRDLHSALALPPTGWRQLELKVAIAKVGSVGKEPLSRAQAASRVGATSGDDWSTA